VRANWGVRTMVNSTGLMVADENEAGVSLGVMKDKGPLIVLTEQGRKIGISIEPSILRVRDHDGHVRVILSAIESGSAGLLLTDPKDRGRLLMITNGKGEPAINILSEVKKSVWSGP